MKKNPDQPADAADPSINSGQELRRRAEERLRRQRPAGGGQTTAVETARLVHELQVHQIELEIQNEELQQARAHAETLLAQYTDFYDCAPVGYMTLDCEGAIRQVNVTGARLFGVERARLVNRRFGLFVAEGDRRTFSDFLQNVFASHAQECCEVTLPQEGSHPLVLQIEGTRSADGQECRAVLLDITARKQAETELSKLNMAVDASGEVIFMTDLEGVIRFMNPAFTRLYGYAAAEVVGKATPRILKSGVVPREVYRSFWNVILSKQVVTGEMFNKARDGRLLTVESSVNPILNEQGESIGVLAIQRDITERKHAEESLRLQSAALNAAPDAIVITDRAGGIEWVNPAFTQLTGYTAEEALGKSPRDLVKSGKHASAFYKQLWETIRAGRTWRGEIINRRKDGRLYTEDQTVTPIRDASGAITHFVAIKKDMTEHLQLEAQFRQAQKMESVGQLASGIAHDFNNLLTVINGMADLVLAQVSQDDPVHADVQEILHAGERAATLTRQLLAFSRQQILEPRVLSLNTVVAGMESLLRRLLGEDIDLMVMLTPGVSHVKVDPGQIEQVITNLAVNARDAMPLGGELIIETHNVTIDEDYTPEHGVVMPSPGSYVLLAVSDSGVGMDEATRARIFEPFFTTKGPGQGTGLGLSTVFGIVKQSQGFIWVYSEVGLGTSFKIYLPQVIEAVGTDQPEPTVVSSSGTETILLVEDNAGLLKLATRVLKPAGYTVLGAASSEEALAALERHAAPVHLLLTDVVMPGMSGRQLAERLAQTHPGMKVLYMSGYTSDTMVRHGVLEATVSFLNKPFTAAALLRKVREVLDS
ncbi:MAG: PAS domain S-box protein [Acidobacteriota bacterium]|nr:PAS domain S-box protein [Acidobacteriota bacterium]